MLGWSYHGRAAPLQPSSDSAGRRRSRASSGSRRHACCWSAPAASVAGRAVSRGRGRRHARPRRLRRRRRHQPAAASAARHARRSADEARVGARAHRRPQSQRRTSRRTRRVSRRERARHTRRIRRRSSTARTLRDALSRERRMRAARQAKRVWLDLPLRGPSVGLLRRGRPMLSMPLPDAASAGVGAKLRRGRRARRAPGLVGTIQATEALKLILGVGDALIGRLLLVDALGMHFRTVRVRRDPKCPACGTREITAAHRLRRVLRNPTDNNPGEHDTRSGSDASRIGRGARARRRPRADRRARTVRVESGRPAERQAGTARVPSRGDVVARRAARHRGVLPLGTAECRCGAATLRGRVPRDEPGGRNSSLERRGGSERCRSTRGGRVDG